MNSSAPLRTLDRLAWHPESSSSSSSSSSSVVRSELLFEDADEDEDDIDARDRQDSVDPLDAADLRRHNVTAGDSPS